MNQPTTEKWHDRRVRLGSILSISGAIFAIVIGYFAPYPLSRLYVGMGIIGLLVHVAMRVCSAISIWSIRNGLELYFDACCHGDCQDRGKEMTVRNFRKWARAQGWQYWWRVMRKKHNA